MLTIILVVGYFLFCVGMAFFLDYRTKKRKLNETAVEYSTGKNSMGLFMAFSLMCGNLISSSYIIGNSSAVIEHDIAYHDRHHCGHDPAGTSGRHEGSGPHQYGACGCT